MAEARKLRAEIVVRQWILAGNAERAIALARIHNAFGPAVVGLEATHPDTAHLLRGWWGQWLAESGRYAAAVDVIWPVEAMRGIAAVWIERALEQGGPVMGRMLVRRLLLRPELWDETLRRIVTLLEDNAPETASARAAIATALDRADTSAVVRTASRAAARSLVRDHALGDVDAQLVRRLALHSGDGALHTDLPPLPPSTLPSWKSSPLLRLEIEPGDSGRNAVHDVAALQDGRLAVALGEAGVDVLAPDGRRIVHFGQPAYRLILSDGRDRAIALARRGSICRLARIDFAARQASYWCDAVIHAFAADYDGAIWFVSNGSEILAVDATAKDLASLWHNPDFPAPIVSIARNDSQLGICGISDHVETWSYDLPSLLLRKRTALETSFADPEARYVAAPDGSLLTATHVIENEEKKKAIVTDDGEPFDELLPRIAGRWLVLEAHNAAGPRILLVDTDRFTSATRASFALRGASAVTARLQPGKLLLGDDQGRVIVLDLVRRRVVRNLRV